MVWKDHTIVRHGPPGDAALSGHELAGCQGHHIRLVLFASRYALALGHGRAVICSMIFRSTKKSANRCAILSQPASVMCMQST